MKPAGGYAVFHAPARPARSIALAPSARVLLLVDDNRGDAILLEAALGEADVGIEFHWLSDSTETLGFLLRRGLSSQEPRPGLVLLDVNMPALDGHDVHALIRAHPQLLDILVAFWSSSDAIDDIARAFDAGAVAYFLKPDDFVGQLALAHDIREVFDAAAR